MFELYSCPFASSLSVGHFSLKLTRFCLVYTESLYHFENYYPNNIELYNMNSIYGNIKLPLEIGKI